MRLVFTQATESRSCAVVSPGPRRIQYVDDEGLVHFTIEEGRDEPLQPTATKLVPVEGANGEREYLTVEVRLQRRPESDEAYFARLIGSLPAGSRISAQIVEEAALPQDGFFFNAWRQRGDAVEVDMDRARGIWLETLRRSRAPLLQALDIAQSRAEEIADPVARAEAKAALFARKQQLRDMTQDPAIAAATTTEALRRVLPAALASELEAAGLPPPAAWLPPEADGK